MKKHPDVLTTGEAAKFCRISQLTIIRQFDKGKIPGFRVPGSRFRKIMLEGLREFMIENKIPTDLLPPPNEVEKNSETT